MRVIAKAYQDRPLDRLSTGRRNRTVYLINPSSVGASGITEYSGVGLPEYSVYEYDSSLLERLQAAWDSANQELLESLWLGARPLKTDSRI